MLIIIGSAGVASVVLHCASLFLDFLLTYIPGDPWTTRARHWLIDIGIPTSFVCDYISFLLLHVPMWLLLFPIMFCLGVSRRVWTKPAAIALALWTPIIDFLVFAMFYVFGTAPEEMREAQLRVLFGIHARIVPAVCGIIICLAAFCLGRRMRIDLGGK